MSDRAFTWLMVGVIVLLTVNAVMVALTLAIVLDTRAVMEPLRQLSP